MPGSLAPSPSATRAEAKAPRFDAAIVGAGAAGLLCAALAGQRGLRVLLLDHWPKVAEKIRISGGGRCNFTNLHTRPENFLSDNPHFCRSALARYGPADIIALLRRHRIGFHEKHKGQLFCDDSAQQLIDALLAECRAGAVTHWQPCALEAVQAQSPGFALRTARGPVWARQLVIATGGLSVPAIGATPLGYRLAEQFGLPVVPPRPALVPLAFDPAVWQPFSELSGVSLPVRITTGSGRRSACFDEDLLFTHRGLSGPAILQASSYWQPGQPLHIDLLPAVSAEDWLARKPGNRRSVAHALAEWLPQRLADVLAQQAGLSGRKMSECSDRELRALWQRCKEWAIVPSGTLGWKKAEVTAGGVDTHALSSTSLMATAVPGLHFIGEVVDVTGWLGGYNFQWAWSSAAACAAALVKAD